MKNSNIFTIISNSLKYNNGAIHLHRWGNHMSPKSDCYQRMENCMAMKYYDYHNFPSYNERIVRKEKYIEDKLCDVSNPEVVMMRMTMIF